VTVRLVVFDLDGTLIDSARDLAAATNAALARFGPGRPPLPEAVVRSFVGEGARLLLERSLAHAGIDAPVEDVLPVFRECYREHLLDSTVLYPGVAEALEALSDRTLAVLTNKPGDFSRAILEGLGVATRFARVWGADDVPARKPDPAGLLRLRRELGARPVETRVVGDSPIDVATARAAGVGVVGVTYGLDPEGVRAAGPDRLIDDLRELKALL